MSTAAKFNFDTTFDLVDQVVGQTPEQDSPPPEPTFSAEDLEAARAKGYNEGHQAGIAEINSSLESAATQAMDHIAAHLSALTPVFEAGLAKCRHEAIGIAHAIGRRVAEQSAQDTAQQVIESVLADMLSRVIDEPRVVIRVHNDLLDTLQQRLSSITAKCGFPGSVILLSEPDLQLPDCRIEWADGGADYSHESVLAEIDTLIGRYRAGINTTMPDASTTTIDTEAQNSDNAPQTTQTELDTEEQSNG